MKTAKKLLAVLMCMAMIFGVMCVGAGAGYYSEGYYDGERGGWRENIRKKTVYPFTFEVYDESEASVIRIDKNAKGEITVPAKVDGVPVTEIHTAGAYEFVPDGCPNVTKITLPDSITGINYCAFSGFTKLEEISIPAGVEYIGWRAFENCSALRKITLPEGLEEIGEEAFLNCTSLEEFNIPSSVVSINGSAFDNTAFYNNAFNREDGALYRNGVLIAAEGISGKYSVKEGTRLIAMDSFRDCDNLYQLTLPASLRYISADSSVAFDALGGLERIKVSKANPYYTADRQGVLYSKDKTVLVAYPRGSVMVSYSVPEGVEYIEDSIENDCLTQIFLPKSIKDFMPIAQNASIYYAGTREEYNQIPGVASGTMDPWGDENDRTVYFGGDSLKDRILAGGLLRAYGAFSSNILMLLKALAHFVD
mgnify:FL=1